MSLRASFPDDASALVINRKAKIIRQTTFSAGRCGSATFSPDLKWSGDKCMIKKEKAEYWLLLLLLVEVIVEAAAAIVVVVVVAGVEVVMFSVVVTEHPSIHPI